MTVESQDDIMPVSPTPRSISRIVIGVILVGLACGVVGLYVGATIGGNMAVDFQFAGNRGYEATGVLGALFGVVGGAIAFTCLHWKDKKF